MKEFFKNYVPYGCVCMVPSFFLQAIVSMNTHTTIQGEAILKDITIGMVLILVDFFINKIDFKTYTRFVIVEYIVITGTMIVFNMLFYSIQIQPIIILKYMVIMAGLLGIIRYYVYRVFRREVDELNASLQA